MTVLRRFGSSWDRLGRENALGAILTRDGRLADWNVDEFLETGRTDAAHFLNELSQVAPETPRTRALDFGCGVGRITRALTEHFDEVIGIDVASSMIERARALTPDTPRCTFVVNRASHLRQFPSGSFAVVYCRLVLQHIEPPIIRRYIPELVRVLQPGGVPMFQLPEPVEHTDPLKAFQQAPIEGNRLKRLLPRPLVSLWRWIKFQFIEAPPPPLMGRFGLPRHEVLGLVRHSGGKVLDVRADDSHGDSVPGFAYWITRPL